MIAPLLKYFLSENENTVSKAWNKIREDALTEAVEVPFLSSPSQHLLASSHNNAMVRIVVCIMLAIDNIA